jgi:hypothetical protein
MNYYPLSKITSNLYTSGNEYYIASTNLDYRGYYFSTYDGKFFTEKTPLATSVEILKYGQQAKQVLTLSSITYVKASGASASVSTTTHYMPTPSTDDYSKGYFIRYLIRRVNGDASSIRELSKDDYNAIQKDPLYNQTAFIWKISGPLEDSSMRGGTFLPGVISFNASSVTKAKAILPGLDQYLINMTQFYK